MTSDPGASGPDDGPSDEGVGGSDGRGSEAESSGSPSGEKQKKNALEWGIFGLGMALVLGVIGYLGYQIAMGPGEPARLVITLGAQRAQGAVVEIDVEVANEGGRVAEGAIVEVCGGPDTCSQLDFEYLPAGAKRQGTIGLRSPLSGPLEARTVSFRMP